MEEVNTHEAGAYPGPDPLFAGQALPYSSSENLSKMPSEMPLRVSPRLRDSDRLHMALTPMGKETVNGVCADLMKMNNYVHDLKEELEHMRDQNSILQTQLRTAVGEEKERNVELVKEYERAMHDRVESRVGERISAVDKAQREHLAQLTAQYDTLIMSQKNQIQQSLEQQQGLHEAHQQQMTQLADRFQMVTGTQQDEIRRLQRHYAAQHAVMAISILLLLGALVYLYATLADERLAHKDLEAYTERDCERKMAKAATSLGQGIRGAQSLGVCTSLLGNVTRAASHAADLLAAPSSSASQSLCSKWPMSAICSIDSYANSIDTALRTLNTVTQRADMLTHFLSVQDSGSTIGDTERFYSLH